MKFIVAVNESEELPDGTQGTVTFDHIETNSVCRRTNRRKLHAYLKARGVPAKYVKRTMKELGFDNAALGITPEERKQLSEVREYRKTL
jgi:hypothetical protein